MKWFWLSFADPDKPKGHQFVGVILMDAPDFQVAVTRCHVMGINPGGDVLGYELGQDPPVQFTHRLLSANEIKATGIGQPVNPSQTYGKTARQM